MLFHPVLLMALSIVCYAGDKGKYGESKYIPTVSLPVETFSLIGGLNSVRVPEYQFFPFLRTQPSDSKKYSSTAINPMHRRESEVLVSQVDPPRKYPTENVNIVPVRSIRHQVEPLQQYRKDDQHLIPLLENSHVDRMRSAPSFSRNNPIRHDEWKNADTTRARGVSTPISSSEWQAKIGNQLQGSNESSVLSPGQEIISFEAFQQLLRGQDHDQSVR
eukprot:GDKJ01016324.1.p1 GENE.GDKJ01016324.1~~GDKJ01016324.1.p1  ORF type:complete len:218 (+),score=26.23 GDKJ01016324.1:149-802(+)